MALGRLPVPVGSFVVEHQQEGSLRIAPLPQIVDGPVREQVRHVALVPPAPARVDHLGIVVLALPGQDVPMVEAGRLALEVPLADHGRLISGRPQELGEGRLGAVESHGVVPHAVEVAVLAGQDDGPAGGADAVSAEAVVEAHALGRDAVDVRGPVDAAPVTTDSLRSVVVGHDEQDVRPLPGASPPAERQRHGQRGRAHGLDEIAPVHRALPFYRIDISMVMNTECSPSRHFTWRRDSRQSAAKSSR